MTVFRLPINVYQITKFEKRKKKFEKRNSKNEAYTVKRLRNGLRWQGVRLLKQYRIN